MKDDVIFEKTQSVFTDYETKRNKPMPSLNHGSIQANLIIQLAPYMDKYRPVSEMSLNLDNWLSVPDISIIPYQMMDTNNDAIKVNTPPLGAIEILSPTQTLTELIIKSRTYFEKGVKSCWVVLPEVQNIYVFSAANEYEIFKIGETLKDEVLGIEMEVGRVFR